jgi:xylan 1,4-beta-xylosidase
MTIHITVDTQTERTPFPHFWELCVGSCHAVMGLRADWRRQLKIAHHELGFRYVRFHGLLDDAMSVVVKDQWSGAEHLSFFNIDSIFDYLLSIGMKPFLELGFMPSALASGTQTCFYYRANVTPPVDYAQWEGLIQSLTRHLVSRYGIDEVRSWFFEVWNEPNLPFFWAGTKEDYFKLYEHAARAVKSVDSQLRVGGPATSVNAWIPDLIAFCQRSRAPLDFISTHHYPTDDPLWRNNELSWEDFMKVADQYERGVLFQMTAKARAEAGKLPLYYTEWNTSAMVPDALHDESFSAAMIAKTVADAAGLVDGYSFWTFTDLFEEGGQHAAPFHGGFGLQTVHGIRKPNYRLFELLHEMGDQRLKVESEPGSASEDHSTVEALAVAGDHRLTILVYNHDTPSASIQEEEVCVRLKGIGTRPPAKLIRIDGEHTNPKKKWQALGSPEYPTKDDLTQITRASRSGVRTIRPEAGGEGCTFRLKIPAHSVAAIVVETPRL